LSPGPGGRYGRFLAVAALGAAGLGALGAPLTRAAAGDAGVPAMIFALAICWVAAAIGGLPLFAASRRAVEEGTAAVQPTPALAAMGLRLGVVVVAAAAVALSGVVPRALFLLWTGIGYVVLLVVETWYAVGEVRRRQPPGGAPAKSMASGSAGRPAGGGEALRHDRMRR